MSDRKTEILAADSPANIQTAARFLQSGRLVAFPTDTVYGVAAHGFLADAIEQLFEAKQRPRSKPIALLVSDPKSLFEIAREVPEEARRLAQQFWPGPLSIILPKAEHLPAILTAGSDKVAIRMPDHPIALAVIDAAGVPLATTSANVSGRPPAITAQDVLQALAGRIDLILDGGACPGGVPSTVLDLTVDPPVILRAGPVTREEIEAIIGRPVIAQALSEPRT